MKKSFTVSFAVCAFMLAATCTQAAGVALTLYNSAQSAAAGQTTVLTYTGKVTVGAGYDANAVSMKYASKTLVGPFLTDENLTSGFNSYLLGANFGVWFEGDLFTITIHPSDVVGDYLLSPVGFGDFPYLAEFGVAVGGSLGTDYAGRDIRVSIVESGEPGVPGPAAAIPMALGLASATLKRRWRR